MITTAEVETNEMKGGGGHGGKPPMEHKSSSSDSDSSKWKIHDTPQNAGLLPTIGVTLFLGWNGFVLWIVLYAIFVADKWQRIIIIGLITLSLVLPVDFPGSLGAHMGDWMMLQSEKYFGKPQFW